VIDAEEKAALGEIHQKRDEIAAPLLKLRVLALRDVVHADVNLGAARHPARQFLAQEKIRKEAHFFRAFDRIVVGEREEIHAASIEYIANFGGITVALATKLRKERGGTCAGEI
jgi:hypothetical protein